MPTLSLAHSPDADDMVMFWPLVGLRHVDGSPFDGALGRPAVDRGEFEFQTAADDVEALNRLAIRCAHEAGTRTPSVSLDDSADTSPARAGEEAEAAADPERGYDISAISAATYPYVKDLYAITSCGASFGEGYGPKVVVKDGGTIQHVDDVAGKRVAVPGRRTTAFLTLTLMIDESANQTPAPPFEAVEMLFSEIPDAVARGEVDAGLLIHEAQLLLEQHGLIELADVGAWWQRTTGLALPLGLNVIKRDLDARFGDGTVARVSSILQSSIVHAREHAEVSRHLLMERAGDRAEWQDEALVKRYLDMYVSDMTVDMGEHGQRALRRLLGEAHNAGLCPDPGAISVV